MNAQQVELALKKQRVMLRIEAQRADLVAGLGRVEALLDAVDNTRERVQGLRQHAPLIAAGALLIALTRPRAALRLARRGWVGWMLYRKLGQRLQPALDAFRRFASAPPAARG